MATYPTLATFEPNVTSERDSLPGDEGFVRILRRARARGHITPLEFLERLRVHGLVLGVRD